MSVTGYSVQHDYEVQEYNQRRTAWKASEKARKQQEKLLREQAKSTQKAFLMDVGQSERRSLWPLSNRKEDAALKAGFEVKTVGRWSTRDSDEITLSEALGSQWK